MEIIGNVLYGQSGGPTSVINSSAFGLIEEAYKLGIKKVYAARYGIDGIINDDLIDLSIFSENELKELKTIPGASFGSVRYKLPEYEKDCSPFEEILKTFKKYNIRYFFYNGGNDSMDTCYKIDRFLKTINYQCYVIGIPKTIDNDLAEIDHTPGYGSAAKYVKDTVEEIVSDNLSYRNAKVNIIEIMGRSAGWLAASSALAHLSGLGPDLIYLPETTFYIDDFIKNVKNIYDKNKRINIVVSEGIKDKNNNFISASQKQDIFGHNNLGGVGQYLLGYVEEKLHLSGRAIELSIPQRAAIHDISKVDQKEAILCGRYAIRKAINGTSGVMISMKRSSNDRYKISYVTSSLEKVANGVKLVPSFMIDEKNHQMTKEFFTYICPIVGAENKVHLKINSKILKK